MYLKHELDKCVGVLLGDFYATGQGRGGSGSSGVRSLHLLHHGREIQCVALMRAPEGQIPLAVITGGEDGIINRLLYTPAQVPLTSNPIDIQDMQACCSWPLLILRELRVLVVFICTLGV